MAGRIDASGVSVGSIRLSARDGLRLASNAVLDAHGATLRVDSYQIIDAPNRAIVELKAGQGTLRLDGGASTCAPARRPAPGRQAARHAGTERAAPERRARRRHRHRGARPAGHPRRAQRRRQRRLGRPQRHPGTETTAAASYQIIDQDYLDRLHDDSRAFITQALANANLVDGKLAGLRPYADALHLRPGIEIRSATPEATWWCRATWTCPATATPASTRTPADRRLRLGRSRQPGDPRRRQIHGSINDGFAPPRT